MEAPLSWLPLDLLLEVLARSDPVTIARGAATCKLLRRHVACPDFRRRLLRHAGRDDGHRFLVGLLYRHARGDEVRVSPAPIPVAAASFLSRSAGGLFDSHRLVASAHGLLVLAPRRARLWEPGPERRRREVCVRDPVTGERASFPLPEAVSGDLYALLPPEGSGDGRRRAVGIPSFRLLVVDRAPVRTRTLSLAEGVWGPATGASELPVLRRHVERQQPFAVVLGGAAYWLYKQVATRVYHVVAVDVGTGQARCIDVPRSCIRRQDSPGASWDAILASIGGELSLVVAEFTAISAWTVREDDAPRWARSVLIETVMILRSVKPLLPWLACQTVEFEWFGERSGSVVFQMHGVGLVLLNLRTKRIYQLETSSRIVSFDLLCPYELDLLSLIASPEDRL